MYNQLIKFIKENYKTLKVTKVFYRNKFLNEYEKQSTFKDLGKMLSKCKDPFEHPKLFTSFVNGKLDFLRLSDSYQTFVLRRPQSVL